MSSTKWIIVETGFIRVPASFTCHAKADGLLFLTRDCGLIGIKAEIRHESACFDTEMEALNHLEKQLQHESDVIWRQISWAAQRRGEIEQPPAAAVHPAPDRERPAEGERA